MSSIKIKDMIRFLLRIRYFILCFIVLWVVLSLRNSSASFLNQASYADKSFWCYTCTGDLIKQYENHPRCREFRKIVRTHSEKWKRTRDVKKIELNKFKVNCIKNDPKHKSFRECYNLKVSDQRILGFEEKGCGPGPRELPTTPGICKEAVINITTNEHFQNGVKIYKTMDTHLMKNCVCDAQFCNGAKGFRVGNFEKAFFGAIIIGTFSLK